ncbi:SET domain-containing protein 3, partial [Coemansia sp. RSA 2610]
MENEYKQTKDTRKRQRYASSKGKKDDNGERRKRVSDSKPRPKQGKNATGRESLSPTSARSVEKLREGATPFDSSYTSINRNILGADVQVLFQSVLSQLAEQRNAVSTAAAAASTSAPPTLTADDKPRNAPPVNGVTISHNATNGNTRTPSPISHAAETPLPPMVPVASDALSSPTSVYRGLAGKHRGQIGLYAREAIGRDRYICEYRGQVVLKAAYKEDPKNYYELLRTTRPYSQFHQEVDLCVDARRQGSEARFVRRSCTANVVLRSMYVVGSDDALIHLGLFAARDIEADEELTVSWEWDDGELPAVASMSPSDAEDYLGRPEGRRMSKVWRQVFGGMACACPDADCDVRKLFAMLGVEESTLKADPTSTLKRRASRPNKISTGAPDEADPDGSPPPARSPDGTGPLRGTHSRKGSSAGPQDGSRSPSAARGSGGAVVSTNSLRDALSVSTGRQPNISTSRQSSAESVRAGVHQRQQGEEGSSSRSTNGQSGPRSRKRKPSTNLDGAGNGRNAPGSASASDCESNGSKKPRSVSGSLGQRQQGLGSNDLPQKKLWISRYLEDIERQAKASSEETTAPTAPIAAEPAAVPTVPAPLADPAANGPKLEGDELRQQPGAEPQEVDVASTATPADNASMQSPKAAMEVERGVVKTEPTDANAPTPSPSLSPSPVGGTVIVESAESPKTPAAKEPSSTQ